MSAPRLPLFTTVDIERYRSIVQASVELGRLTVVIGANGAGKSNLLEAIALLGAASAEKGDVEFLASRGIRVAPAEHMVSRFAETPLISGLIGAVAEVRIGAQGHTGRLLTSVFARADEVWQPPGLGSELKAGESSFHPLVHAWVTATPGESALESITSARAAVARGEPYGLSTFLIYSPEYRALRTFAEEGQIRPIGVNGEGLFAHLWDLAKRRPDVVTAIGERVKGRLDWFDGFSLPTDLGPGERRLSIRDRYLGADVALDQRSANEGFLFLLFVYTLLLSPDTPRFFAIDNVDASLNPLLCRELTRDIAALAREHDKQVLLTTHNPAVLDGLDLTDPEQRLFVAERDLDGHSGFRRVVPKGEARVPLSEAFLRGYLGGLPRGF